MHQVITNPGIFPTPGQINSPPYWIDDNGARPPRINQWSAGLQREIIRDLVVEANYVGNRGVWEQANSLINLNAPTTQELQSHGLNINNAADRTLLNSRMNSALAISSGITAPYAGFPMTLTVAQALRPYPQFGNITVDWAPLGGSWYDSLQVKATKRYAHGLDLTAAFTWQDEMASGAESEPANNVYNRPNQKYISPYSMPLVFVTSFTYTIPRFGTNRWLRKAAGDWIVSGMLRYSSGLPILVPTANNALSSLIFQSTFANRVPGQPLFLKNLNCHCFDPNTTFVLNPAAWSDPAAGQWGTSAAYYNDYRSARRYDEQLGLGRVFPLREKMSLTIRAEFFNVFNRTYLNSPDSTNALATQTVNASGQVVSGFGRINTGSTYGPPRNGQIVARFQW